MTSTFLSASVPLTKTVEMRADGTLEKSPYPNVYAVTSHVEDTPDITSFHAALVKHAALGHCLLKGNTSRPLVNESRAGSTDASASTSWVCLDIDGLPAMYNYKGTPTTITPAAIMQFLGLQDVSHVLQWSASQGLDGGATLRLHIFFLLPQPVPAQILKQWLIQLNHTIPLLRDSTRLTKTGNSLTWALDITACQNDKLLYIAPPTFKGMKSPMGRTPRIQLITRSYSTFTLPHSVHTSTMNKALTDERIAELRETHGLPTRKFTYKMTKGIEHLIKPEACDMTEMKADRGFVYFNLNGGDSWAYYHPEDRPEFIFNFKGEPTYLTKELLPEYWEQLTSTASRTSSAGVTYLAFLDKKASTYYRGTYDPDDRKALHCYVSDDAHARWHGVADETGLTVSAILEALAPYIGELLDDDKVLRFILIAQ